MEKDITTDNIIENTLTLSSTHSMKISLEAVRNGKAGLDAHRQRMLDRAPENGDWAKFQRDTVELKDLAYLTAKVGDEFTLLRGKHEDILFHGDNQSCRLDVFENELKNRKYVIVGHSHPGEDDPKPSDKDRNVLKLIGQDRSSIVSGRTGKIIDFGADRFEIF